MILYPDNARVRAPREPGAENMSRGRALKRWSLGIATFSKTFNNFDNFDNFNGVQTLNLKEQDPELIEVIETREPGAKNGSHGWALACSRNMFPLIL